MQVDKELLWQQVCEELSVSLSQPAITSWVKPCRIDSILSVTDDRVIVELSAPTFFHAQTIDERYYSQIRTVMEKHLEKNCELAVKINTPSYISFETVLAQAGVIFQFYESVFVASHLSKIDPTPRPVRSSWDTRPGENPGPSQLL